MRVDNSLKSKLFFHVFAVTTVYHGDDFLLGIWHVLGDLIIHHFGFACSILNPADFVGDEGRVEVDDDVVDGDVE